jgi:tetraprenyl-beta-curcumene synthase
VSRAFHPRTALGLLLQARTVILPGVGRALAGWRARAAAIPSPELRLQALDSIQHKAFHCEGGALLAGRERQLLPLIVAYQTLADYLDNLCDRSSCRDPQVFDDLHRSMTDAVAAGRPAADGDYYARWPAAGSDGGYLPALVATCQGALGSLPHHQPLAETALRLAALYRGLQVKKHGPRDRRERDVRAWCEELAPLAPELRWYERAAATGSTLALFHLFGVAARPAFDQAAADGVLSCYFRWICPLHILLDYLVDGEEDEQGGDLNFVSCYRDQDDALARLSFLIAGARAAAAKLPEGPFHAMIVDGLLGLYLGDAKVDRQPRVRALAWRLLRAAPPRVWFFYLGCRARRGSEARLQPPPVRARPSTAEVVTLRSPP